MDASSKLRVGSIALGFALGAIFFLLPLGQASAHHRVFESSAEACEFIAKQALKVPVLCPVTLPERVTWPGARYDVEPRRSWRSGDRWELWWIPDRGRGPLGVSRYGKKNLRRMKQSLRQQGRPIREVEVRGRRGIFTCRREWLVQDDPGSIMDEAYCWLGWRELGNTYYVLGNDRGISRRRVRGDIHAVADALEPVSPAS